MSYVLTPEQEALLERVEELKRDKGVSQNKAGEIIGLTGSALSQLKNGTYKSPEAGFRIIENYFAVKDKAKLTYQEPEYVPTSISSEIYSVIRVCQIKGGLSVIVGDAGIGKTKAAQKFVSDNPTNSILITVNPCLTGVKPLLECIADKIGAVPERSANKLWLSVVKKLSDGMVLIFDEAQQLTIKEIETLRSISDYFTDKNQTLGICFIGNPETVVYMRKRKAEFAQIANRTKQIKVYTRADIKREDIIMLFPMLEENHMEKEITLMHGITQTEQSIRGAVNAFSNACDNDNCTYNGLVAAAKYTGADI